MSNTNFACEYICQVPESQAQKIFLQYIEELSLYRVEVTARSKNHFNNLENAVSLNVSELTHYTDVYKNAVFIETTDKTKLSAFIDTIIQQEPSLASIEAEIQNRLNINPVIYAMVDTPEADYPEGSGIIPIAYPVS